MALTASELLNVFPVDTRVNRLGWGLDVHLGYLARHAGLCAVVDHAMPVHHPMASGYDGQLARAQRDAWYGTLPPAARLFRQLVCSPLTRTVRAASTYDPRSNPTSARLSEDVATSAASDR